MVAKQWSSNHASVGIAASYATDKVCQAVTKAIFIFLARILRITLTLHYVTRAIHYLTVSTEGLSEGFVAIRTVDQRVDIGLTRHMAGLVFSISVKHCVDLSTISFVSTNIAFRIFPPLRLLYVVFCSWSVPRHDLYFFVVLPSHCRQMLQ